MPFIRHLFVKCWVFVFPKDIILSFLNIKHDIEIGKDSDEISSIKKGTIRCIIHLLEFWRKFFILILFLLMWHLDENLIDLLLKFKLRPLNLIDTCIGMLTIILSLFSTYSLYFSNSTLNVRFSSCNYIMLSKCDILRIYNFLCRFEISCSYWDKEIYVLVSSIFLLDSTISFHSRASSLTSFIYSLTSYVPI